MNFYDFLSSPRLHVFLVNVSEHLITHPFTGPPRGVLGRELVVA